MNINILDLFSGIGGFSQGLKQAGFNIKKHFYSEVDKHAQAIYKNRFSNAQAVGDVRHVRGSELGEIDITTFGFPCQDMSVAGKRKGFGGDRSVLFYEAMRIIRECKSSMFIWENVGGILSSRGGRDIEAIFDEMYISGYFYDIKEQNTSWYLPQNRLRYYCIAYSGNYLCQILKDAVGQKKKSPILKNIIQGYLLHRFQKDYVGQPKELETRQKVSGLESAKDQLQEELTGSNLRLRFCEIMSIAGLKSLEKCYLDTQALQLKQKDISLGLLFQEKVGQFQGDIHADGAEKTVRSRLFSYIEKCTKNISEESLRNLSISIISTWTNKITGLKTYSYAEMQAITELFTVVLTPLFPNLWDEALLDLIEKERNTLYAKTGRNKTKIDPEKNNPAVRCKSRASEQLDAFSSIANRCTGQVFPIGENNKRNSEKIRKRRIIRGRNKNTQGCIDTRGGTRSSRADLDNYIYDYDKQTVRRTTPLEHERLNGFEDGWTVLGDSRDTDAKRNFRLGNAVTVDVVEAVGRAIIIGTEIRP